MKPLMKLAFAATLVGAMFLPSAKAQHSCNATCQACMGNCQSAYNSCMSACEFSGIGPSHTASYCQSQCQPQETACTNGCLQ